jgi:hypothetical protein
LFPFTTRLPRLTRVSEGNPFRRLLVASKPGLVEVFGFGIHGAPPIGLPLDEAMRIIAGADIRCHALQLPSNDLVERPATMTVT